MRKSVSGNQVTSLSERLIGVRRRLLSGLGSRLRAFIARRFTIMLIPHNDQKPIHFQINTALLLVIGFVLTAAIVGFFLMSTLYSGSAQKNIESSVALTKSQTSLDSVLVEVKELMKVYQVFEGTMGGTLKELNIQPGTAGNRGSTVGDLSRMTDSQEISESQVREANELKRLSKALSDTIMPLSEIGDVLKAQRSLLSDIPNVWPVKGPSAITMEFGPNLHPITGLWYLHKGLDIAAGYGSPVVAAANGKVVEAAYEVESGYGNVIVIEHKYGFRTRYCHLSAFYVQTGQEVTQGQQIAAIGNTGITTGPHTHFELMLGTQVLDPSSFLKIHTDFSTVEVHP